MGYNHESWKFFIHNPITDEMKELRLVLVYTQKLLPVTWYALVVFHVPSDTFTSLRTCGCFRLSFQYASNTTSTRCTSPRNCLRTYSMTCVTYQSNESGVRGFIMLTTAAPSRITMWASCALTVSWCVTSSETHNKRSDFVPELKAPWLDREGGYDWFSCKKKSAMPVCRTWQAMYRVENKVRSLLSHFTWFCCLGLS